MINFEDRCCGNCAFQARLIMWERDKKDRYLPNHNKELTCCTAFVGLSDGSNTVYGHTERTNGKGMCECWCERGNDK